MVGDSGCEDSEDEWDFIKIDKESDNKPSNSRENQKLNEQKTKMSSEIFNNQLSDNIKDTEIKSDMQSEPLTDEYNEKDLVYNIDDSEKNDENFNENSAGTKLNPGAAEFIPRSPASPVHLQNPLLLLDDLVVAESPKANNKDAVSALMENINVPSELEFDAEISNRPHETEDTNDFIAGENLNPKEAAQSDEKLEEDYIAISNGVSSTEQSANLITFDRFNEPEAMQESFYEENRCDELNKIQTLPLSQEQDPLVEQLEEKVNCLIEETGDMMNFDNINQVIVDPSNNLPVQQQSADIQVCQEEKIESVVEPVKDIEVCQQVLDPVPDLLNSDHDLNKLVEQCDEKVSNIEITPIETTIPSATEMETIKNEANQIVTDNAQKQPELENLLIITATDEATVAKTNDQELIQSEKVSEVLIAAIPDVIPKPVEKSSTAPAEKPKVPAAKTVAKKPLGTKPTPAVDRNGMKGVVAPKATTKTNDIKKPIGSTMAARTTATATARAPATARTVTSRTTGTTTARSIASSTTRTTTTTTTTTASRVGTR